MKYRAFPGFFRLTPLALLSCTGLAFAEPQNKPLTELQSRPLSFILGAGLTHGGDDLVDVIVEDHDDDLSSEDVSAGGFIHTSHRRW